MNFDRIIHNVRIITLGSEEVKVIENGAIEIVGGLITRVGAEKDILESNEKKLPLFDGCGKTALPGFVCAHGHFYGLYSRGLDLLDAPGENFLGVLEKLWWRLDRALDNPSSAAGAAVFAVEGLRAGTTTILDHHASPAVIEGSLDAMAEQTMRVGVRAALCYEVTDRNGIDGADEGIKENIRFMRRCAQEKNDFLGANFGLHAPFTCCDETLAKCAKEMEAFKKDFPEYPAGFHIHVAEGADDEELSLKEHGMRCVPRLQKAGILGKDTIVGHGVFLDDDEIKILAETGTNVVTNPESNMNNAVGLPRLQKMLDAGVCVGLGTDGMTYDMIQEYKASCIAHKLNVHDPRAGTMASYTLLFRNNSLIASKFFPHPVGRLEPGCYGDVVLLDTDTPTVPLNAGSFPWQMHFGVSSLDVHTVFVGGRILLEDHKVVSVDPAKIYAEARELCPAVWERFAKVVADDKAKKAAAQA